MPLTPKKHRANQHCGDELRSPHDSRARVGIITPCYNAEAFVGETIASVDAQTFVDWRHVVVNDGSTDRTAAILDTCDNKDPRRQIVHQTNQGQAAANNRAATLLANRVDYLLFLDADDILAPSALETAVAYLDQHPGVVAVHWRFEVVDDEGTELPTHYKSHWHRRHVPTRFGVRVLPDEAAETPLSAVITHCGMIPSCMLMRQSAFAITEGFSESTLMAAGLSDVDLFIQLALQAPIHRVPDVLTQYRVHENQFTANGQKMNRQYEKLLRRWREIASGGHGHSRLQRALLFAECRKLTSDWLGAAAHEWKNGNYLTAARLWTITVARYLWSLLPSCIAAPLYLKMRTLIERRGAVASQNA
jgi:glycosyltransferase involved in cell wall biosynthesis